MHFTKIPEIAVVTPIAACSAISAIPSAVLVLIFHVIVNVAVSVALQTF